MNILQCSKKYSFSYTVKPTARDVKEKKLIGSISVEVDFLQRTQLVAKSVYLCFQNWSPPIPLPPPLPLLSPPTLPLPPSIPSSPLFPLLPYRKAQPAINTDDMASFFREKFCDNVFCSGQVVSIFEHTVAELQHGRIIVYWVLLKCTVFRSFSGQRRRSHCWKEQCYRLSVSLLFFSHSLPFSLTLSILPATFLSGRHDTVDWRRLKDFKEGTTSATRFNKIAIFGVFFFGVGYYQQGCKIMA